MRVNHCFIVLSLFGAATVGRPAKAQITNGGFETGTLTGFTSSGIGSVQVLKSGQLGILEPTQGTYFALVGNGPGDIGSDGLPDQGILTSSPFTLASSGTLSLDYDFLTAEFTGANSDPTRLDSFAITLIPTVGSTSSLASGNVSATNFTLIDSGNIVTAPDGTSVIEHQGIKTAHALIPAGSYTLKFQVDDAGDGAFDSALLLDNIAFKSGPINPNVPEPSAIVTLTLGCVSLLGLARKARLRRQNTAQ